MQNSEFRMQKRQRALRQWMRCLHSAFCILHCGLLAACSHPRSPVQVSQSGTGAYEAALVTDDAGFVVAWYDTRDGNGEIYLRRLDANGTPIDSERRLTESPDASYEASIERLGDAFVVAWYEQTEGGRQTAMLGAWNRDGSRKWAHEIAAASRNPVIRSDGREIVAAWIQSDPDGSEAVWVGSWNGNGTETRPRTWLGPASKTTWNLNLAVDGPEAWVVFDAMNATRSNELFLGRVGPAGVLPLKRLTRDDGMASKYPDLQTGAQGRVALTWYDTRDGNDEVYLVVTRQSELGGEIDDRARRITTTEGESIGAYVAWNGERVGLAWSDKTLGQHEVYFQSFDGAGQPLTSAERLTTSDTWSLVPAIRPWREGFALAWTEYRPASGEIHEGTGEVAFTLVD
jgi:hypothetical protein